MAGGVTGGGRGRGATRGRLRVGTGGLEVELGPGTVEDDGGPVVGPGGVLGGGESAKPLPRPLTRLADLGHPFPPAALAHAAVPELVVVGASLALALFVVGFCWCCGGGGGG